MCCGGSPAAFVFHVDGRIFSIPGYMVWAAILYAGSGSLLSYWVGAQPDPPNADRYQRESELRTTLNRSQRAYRPYRQRSAAKRRAAARSHSISKACSKRCASW